MVGGVEQTVKTPFLLFAYHLLLIALGLSVYFLRDACSFCGFNPIWLNVSLFGLIGGALYCIRSIYIQYCVKSEWDNRWIVWHVLRPFASTICGAVSLLFVRAGLLLFEAPFTETQSSYGIYALAFIAGLNVDNFIKKLESIFREIVGIRESRMSGEK